MHTAKRLAAANIKQVCVYHVICCVQPLFWSRLMADIHMLHLCCPLQALEHTPEVFAQVEMLYVNMEVSNVASVLLLLHWVLCTRYG